MKRVLLAMSVLSVPFVSMAAAPTKAEWQNLCKGVARTGAVIMKGRQQGLPMIKSMEIAGDKPGAISEFAKTLVIQAYDRPKYQSKSMQQQEIQDFEDMVFKTCLAQFKE